MVSRALKKEETREVLIRAAAEIFAAKGFDSTTVDEIVARAGVSQRTFFRYFATKLDVALPHNEARLARLRALLKEYFSPSNPIRSIRRALASYCTSFQADREEILREHVLITSSHDLAAKDLEWDARWNEEIRQVLLRSGMPELESAVVSGAIFGAICAVVDHWASGRGKGDVIELGRPAFNLIDSLADAYDNDPARFGVAVRQSGAKPQK